MKQHTDFKDNTESGLLKLLAIGIGNHKGAENIHANALRLGYGPVIRDAAELMLKKLPVLFAIAITENWRHETNNIVAVYPEKILETEKDFLRKVKETAAKLPIDCFDTLIVEEAGKNISGTCIDTKVVGRIMIHGQKEPETPRIKTIAVLNFTDESHGNSMGLGIADIITQKVYDKIDIKATSLTGMTSTCLLQAKIPCVASNDLEAINVAFTSAGIEKKENIKAIYIKNTNSLEYLVVTENIYELIRNDVGIMKIGEPFELEFDKTGALITKVFN